MFYIRWQLHSKSFVLKMTIKCYYIELLKKKKKKNTYVNRFKKVRPILFNLLIASRKGFLI